MKKWMFLFYIGLGILLIAYIIFILNWDSRYPKEKNSKEELPPSEVFAPTPEVLEFIDYYRRWIDFNHPYVTCIFEQKCNGTFELGMDASLTENKTELEDFLNRYGKVMNIYAFDYYSIYFETDNLYKISPILNSSKFSDVKLYRIKSDYRVTSEKELLFCEFDDDCVPISGCCDCSSGGGRGLVNKKYFDNLSSYYALACHGMGCTAVMSNDWTCLGTTTKKCINNSCLFVNYTEAPCETGFYYACRNELPKSTWDEKSTFGQLADGTISCRGIINLCEGNKSKEEIYEICLNELNISLKYNAGEVLIYFDPNATEEEIDHFIGESELEIERKLTDYYYEIRGIQFNDNGTFEEFINYLNSSGKTQWIPYAQPDLIIVYFSGDISFEESEGLLKNYENLLNLGSFRALNAERIGIAKVPEGEEAEWICKLREEEILFRVGFRT